MNIKNFVSILEILDRKSHFFGNAEYYYLHNAPRIVEIIVLHLLTLFGLIPFDSSRDYYLHNARRIMEIIVFSILRKFRIQDYYLQYVHLPSKFDQNLHNAHILKMKKQTNIVCELIQE